MENRKVRVAITHGDTNGVGYEVIFKAFEDPTILELCTPIIYGSPKVAAYHRNALKLETPFSIISDADAVKDDRLNLLACINEEVKVDLGQPTDESAAAAGKALARAVEDFGQGAFDVLVMAPTADENALRLEQQLGGGQKLLEVLVNEDLRVALVTNNVPLKDVADAITKEKIVEKARLFHQCLRRDMRISSPRIAVLALNPHAGMSGELGEEENEVIAPAIAELEQQGIQAFGPYAADEFFGSGHCLRFDGVLAMYHDQGMTPFRTMMPDGNVKLTAGLDIVATAPDHGPEFGQAGNGTTDAASMRHAIYLAIDVARNRQNYDEPLANPLPKLYHEKRDDSEKVRFSIPKNKEQPKRENKNGLPTAENAPSDAGDSVDE